MNFTSQNLKKQNSVDIRYPDEFYIPEPEEAKKSFYLADHFKNFVLAKLGILEEDIKIQ